MNHLVFLVDGQVQFRRNEWIMSHVHIFLHLWWPKSDVDNRRDLRISKAERKGGAESFKMQAKKKDASSMGEVSQRGSSEGMWVRKEDYIINLAVSLWLRTVVRTSTLVFERKDVQGNHVVPNNLSEVRVICVGGEVLRRVLPAGSQTQFLWGQWKDEDIPDEAWKEITDLTPSQLNSIFSWEGRSVVIFSFSL